MQTYAPVVLRIGVALVIGWFGLNQVIEPAAWMGWLPGYAARLPFDARTLVFANGLFESLIALLLLIGWQTRIAGGLLALHMAHIMTIVGYGEVGVRDFALFVGALSVFFHGADHVSLDRVLERQKIARS